MGFVIIKSSSGTRTLITKVIKDANGSTEIILKRETNKKFFNSFSVIRANFEKTIKEKRILFIK